MVVSAGRNRFRGGEWGRLMGNCRADEENRY